MFSELAILFYSIVYIPQFFLIWHKKSSDGISLPTIILWTQADFLSLIGSIFLQLNKSIIIIEWYHSLTSSFMIVFSFCFLQYTLYTKLKLTPFIVIFIIANVCICCLIQQTNQENKLIGEICGWLTSFIYIFGRFPQLYKNWIRKSTEGLSITMYVLTMIANVFYLISIWENNNGNISIYIPWITLIFVSLILDFFVLFQWYKYNNKKIKDFIKLNRIDSEIGDHRFSENDNSSECDSL